MKLTKPKRRVTRKVDTQRKRLTIEDLKRAIEMMQREVPIIIFPTNAEVKISPFSQSMLPKSLQVLNRIKRNNK